MTLRFLKWLWKNVKSRSDGSKNFVLNDANIVTKKVCWTSIEILASKLPDVMGTYKRLSHTLLSCILSCVHTSKQDVWCWWPWLTGTAFRYNIWVIKSWVIKWPVKLCTFFFQNPKTWLFTFFWVADHVLSNTAVLFNSLQAADSSGLQIEEAYCTTERHQQ